MKKHIDNAVIISATLVRETSSAYYLNCEGDRVWVAKSQCNFDPDKQELEAKLLAEITFLKYKYENNV